MRVFLARAASWFEARTEAIFVDAELQSQSAVGESAAGIRPESSLELDDSESGGGNYDTLNKRDNYLNYNHHHHNNTDADRTSLTCPRPMPPPPI